MDVLISYITLEDIQDQATEAGLPDVSLTDSVITELLKYAREATQFIDEQTERTFSPMVDTIYYDRSESNYDGFKLLLNYPLVELTSVDVEGTTVDATSYRLQPRGQTPYTSIQRLSGFGGWGGTLGSIDDEIAVNGVWADRPNYDTAWINTNDTVQDNPLSASATTITVTDADGTDELGYTRFSPGQLLRIEDEYIILISVNTTTNTLTVKRGARGSTAASHVLSTEIEWFRPKLDIVTACKLIMMYSWKRRGKMSTIQSNGFNTRIDVEIPQKAYDIIAANSPKGIHGA